VFRYIVTQDSDGREGWQEVKAGDVVSVMFDARIFSGSSFSQFPLFYSNNATTIEIYRGSNDQFDSVEWPTTPLVVTLGSGQLMPVIENALVGCREGDKVQLFVTPDKAYGGKQNYSVPAYSTLAFEITIEEITE
jgi:FKBP-type peptidyl-prolyl cis-trans isomerase 2